MLKPDGFVPEIGQEVLVSNKLGLFRVIRVNSKARSASVTALHSGASLERIPWASLVPWNDEIRDLIHKAATTVDPMTCRQFEDAMQVEFADADANYWRDLIANEKLDQLHNSLYRDHLRSCSDCQTSLWQFFDIRRRVDYRREPCFHVAYYSADVRDRCLEKIHGMYSIATKDEREHGVIISRCPWCGVDLPLGARQAPVTSRIN